MNNCLAFFVHLFVFVIELSLSLPISRVRHHQQQQPDNNPPQSPPPPVLLSSIVAISMFTFCDPGYCYMNRTPFPNTGPPPASIYYQLPTSQSAKDPIVGESIKQIREGSSQSIAIVTEEGDELMKEVGIKTRIDTDVGAVTVTNMREDSKRILKKQQQSKRVRRMIKPDRKQRQELQASGLKKIATENKIEVELKDSEASIKIDRENFTKVKIVQPPFLQYLPSSVQPLLTSQFKSVKVLKSIPDDQLFIASVVAGSLTEIFRTILLYPLSTVKSRVQARNLRSTNRKRRLWRKLKVTWLTFLYETKRGDWYAGLLPSLLISVPASGVYAGTKEVSKRAFTMAIPLVQRVLPSDETASTVYSALVISLLAAFVADITSLALKTPADVLSLRLQVFGETNVNSDLSNWAKDSIALLPAMILTDTPYLLSRIFLNAAVTTSGENLGTYEVETVAVACLCAFLTTPFDVARTRILLPALLSEEDSDGSKLPLRRLVAPSKYRKQRRQKLSVLLTMKRIAAEGNGGLQNLFTGWLERTVFLGLGRGWFDPIRIIGYLGLRDAILLKLFD
jgi:hypothetical protein